MFQDEARFGRMAKPRRCWAPKPCRPVMLNGYEREFVYAYGAVSPREGDFDWKICPEMNTRRMSEFLEQVGQRYPRDFIVMIVDGASSHREKEFPNRVFDSLDGVKKQLRSGLIRLARDGIRVRSVTAWPWIVTLNLKAN